MKVYEVFAAEFLIKCEYDTQTTLETKWGSIYVLWEIQ